MEGWLNGRAARGEVAATTVETYARNIRYFVTHLGPDLPLAAVTPEHIEGWLAAMANDGRAASTRNARMVTIRAFFRWATDRRLIDIDPTRQVRRARLATRPPKRLPAAQVQAVLNAAPFRTRVIIIIATQLMLRRSELAALRVDDWDRAPTAGAPHGLLYIRGKGAKDRWVPVTAEAADLLDRWLADGRLSGPMWPSSHRPSRGLGDHTIGGLITAAGEAAGVKVWPHLLRHTGASDVAASGAPLGALQQALGHENLATTSVYVHSTRREVAAAIEGRQYYQRVRRVTDTSVGRSTLGDGS